jgi:hypothetical protein
LDALLSFLETEVIAHLLEGWEGRHVGEDGAKMLIPFVEAAEYVEDEHTIGDVGAKIIEGVSEPLHFPTVVIHVEVALNDVVEDGIDVGAWVSRLRMNWFSRASHAPHAM